MGPDGMLAAGVARERLGDLAGAERWYRKADGAGSADAPAHLGVLLFERGDVDAARVCLVRSDERGSALGSFRLGYLLAHVGEYDAAAQAYRRAADRGDPSAAGNLATLDQFRQTRDTRDPEALLRLGAECAARGDRD